MNVVEIRCSLYFFESEVQRPHTESIHHCLPGLSFSLWLLDGQVPFVASSGTQKQMAGFAKATSSSPAHNQHLEP